MSPPRYDKKKKDEPVNEMVQSMSADAILEKDKRRKKTFTTMGVSTAVRAAMDEAMSGLLINVDADQSAEDKLKAVMIAAKQTGMSVDKIFSYFKNSTSDSSDLTAEQFGAALKSLSPTIFDLEEDEVMMLVQKFDTDGDGKVSYPEFRHYCYYNINAVCWKAERLRMEKSGAMDAMEAEYKHLHEPAHNDDEVPPEDITIETGEKIYEGNKLFWRKNHTLMISMWHNTEVNCIAIMCWNETEDKHFPPIFVDSSRIPIDEAAVEAKVGQMTADQQKQKQSAPSSREALKTQVLNDMYAQHILARLKVPDSSNPFPKATLGNKLPPLTPRSEELMPFLTLLSTDVSSIMIPRPVNYVDPPKYKKLEHVDLNQFNKLLSEVTETNKGMKSMRTNAERMTQLLDLSMMAFKNAESDRERKRTMGKHKRRWMTSFTTWIVRQQVAAVREVLKESPAYQELVKEQEEKKAAKDAGVSLPPI